MSLLDLFRPRWRNSDPFVCKKAVATISDPKILWRVILDNDYYYVRDAAFDRLPAESRSNQPLLIKALRDRGQAHAAFQRKLVEGHLTDRNTLLALATSDASKDVAAAAAKKLTEQPIAAQVAISAPLPEARMAAAANISSAAVAGDVVGQSSDVRVKEFVLKRMGKELAPSLVRRLVADDPDEGIRSLALGTVADDAERFQLALTHSKGINLNLAAIQFDDRQLERIAREALAPRARETAIARIADRGVLRRLLDELPDKAMRRRAYDRLIPDQALSADLARRHQDPEIRIASIKKLSSADVLREAAGSDSDTAVRIAALDRLDDLDFVIETALFDRDEKVRGTAFGRFCTLNRKLPMDAPYFTLERQASATWRRATDEQLAALDPRVIGLLSIWIKQPPTNVTPAYPYYSANYLLKKSLLSDPRIVREVAKHSREPSNRYDTAVWLKDEDILTDIALREEKDSHYTSALPALLEIGCSQANLAKIARESNGITAARGAVDALDDDALIADLISTARQPQVAIRAANKCSDAGRLQTLLQTKLPEELRREIDVRLQALSEGGLARALSDIDGALAHAEAHPYVDILANFPPPAHPWYDLTLVRPRMSRVARAATASGCDAAAFEAELARMSQALVEKWKASGKYDEHRKVDPLTGAPFKIGDPELEEGRRLMQLLFSIAASGAPGAASTVGRFIEEPTPLSRNELVVAGAVFCLGVIGDASARHFLWDNLRRLCALPVARDSRRVSLTATDRIKNYLVRALAPLDPFSDGPLTTWLADSLSSSAQLPVAVEFLNCFPDEVVPSPQLHAAARSPAFVQWLKNGLGSANPVAVKMARMLPSPASVPLLLEATEQLGPAVRAPAARALATLLKDAVIREVDEATLRRLVILGEFSTERTHSDYDGRDNWVTTTMRDPFPMETLREPAKAELARRGLTVS